MSEERVTLLDWLGFKSEFDFRKSPFLGVLLGFAIVVVFVLLTIFCFVGVGMLMAAILGLGPYSGDPTGASIRNLGLVLGAIIGMPFLVWRSLVAQRNANTAEQSQITDRINKAVLGLGSEKIVKRIFEKPKFQKAEDGNWLLDEGGNPVPALRPDGTPLVDREQYEETAPNIEVRVGAALSLERIARDSTRDQFHILDILCTYVRENSKGIEQAGRSAREDIQAAINVVANRRSGKSNTYAPDLRGANLDGIRTFRADFRLAKLNGSSWRSADARWSDFADSWASEGCDFSDADLEGANFDGAELKSVVFTKNTMIADASFEKANLSGLKFSGTDMAASNFKEATLHNCNFTSELILRTSFRAAWLTDSLFYRAGFFANDFRDAKNWKQDQFDAAFGVTEGEGKTLLPSGANYPSHWIDLSQLDEESDPFATFVYYYEEWKWPGRREMLATQLGYVPKTEAN